MYARRCPAEQNFGSNPLAKLPERAHENRDL